MGGYLGQATKKGGILDKGAGAVVGGAVGGPAGAIYGGSRGVSGAAADVGSITHPGDNSVVSKMGGSIDKNNPYVQGPRDAQAAADASNKAAGDLYSQTLPLNKLMNQADTNYSDKYSGAADKYLQGAQGITADYTNRIKDLDKQAAGQATDASNIYSNSILPEYQNAMGMAKTNAGQAMSLAEASNPNNPLAKGVRDLYSQQAQQERDIYNQQAQQTRDVYNKQGNAVRAQGQQDFGVLSALGAQAAKGQFGAAPGVLTAGQMGQIYGQNQGQASSAYANAQQRMYALQQQGLDRGQDLTSAGLGRSSDLQSAGLGRSLDQSNAVYGMGQQAQDRYSNTIKDLQGGQNAYDAGQAAFRNERGGYAGNISDAGNAYNSDKFNVRTSVADVNRGNVYASTGRQQNALNQRFGVQQQNINNQSAENQANSAAKGQFISAGLGAAARAYAGS